MRALAFVLFVVAACGDNKTATPTGDAGVDAPTQQVLAPCLDRPTDVPRAPTGQLTCDLLPPGFKAQ